MTFSGRIPVITAFLKGKTLRSPRWNALFTQCRINGQRLSCDADKCFGAESGRSNFVDTTLFTASTNSCEEMVTTTNLDDTITSADPATDIITLTGVNNRLQYQTGDRVVLIGGSLPIRDCRPQQIITLSRISVKTLCESNWLRPWRTHLPAPPSISPQQEPAPFAKNAEPRYFGGGIIESSEQPDSNIETLFVGNGRFCNKRRRQMVFESGRLCVRLFLLSRKRHYKPDCFENKSFAA